VMQEPIMAGGRSGIIPKGRSLQPFGLGCGHRWRRRSAFTMIPG